LTVAYAYQFQQVCYDVRCDFDAWSFTLIWSSLILE